MVLGVTLAVWAQCVCSLDTALARQVDDIPSACRHHGTALQPVGTSDESQRSGDHASHSTECCESIVLAFDSSKIKTPKERLHDLSFSSLPSQADLENYIFRDVPVRVGEVPADVPILQNHLLISIAPRAPPRHALRS